MGLAELRHEGGESGGSSNKRTRTQLNLPSLHRRRVTGVWLVVSDTSSAAYVRRVAQVTHAGACALMQQKQLQLLLQLRLRR